MSFRATKVVLLATVFALATSIVGFAQAPCGVPNQITCDPWDGGSNLFASQNDVGGFGNFATTYMQFTLAKPPQWGTWDVESFHFIGGYFNPPNFAPISNWTVNFYSDNGGVPGAVLGTATSNSVTAFSLGNVNGFPMYLYHMGFQSIDLPGQASYFASVVPDLSFPPQWGWATAIPGGNDGYQCFFGTCGPTGVDYAFAVDGHAVPEPGTLIMLGTGILGLAGSLRRKLL